MRRARSTAALLLQEARAKVVGCHGALDGGQQHLLIPGLERPAVSKLREETGHRVTGSQAMGEQANGMWHLHSQHAR